MRKFQDGEFVKVNNKAKGDSYFVGKVGKIAGYIYPCYDVEFSIPGNGRTETRRLKAYKLSKSR